MQIYNIINHNFNESIDYNKYYLLYECDVKHYSYLAHIKIYSTGNTKQDFEKKFGVNIYYTFEVNGIKQNKKFKAFHYITNWVRNEEELLHEVKIYVKYNHK